MSQLHQRKRSKESLSDEYETPDELYNKLCNDYDIIPHLDVATNQKNSKCEFGLFYANESHNALNYEWHHPELDISVNVWCNPPHSLNEKFVRKAFEQWQKHNINIMMLLPCNTQSSKYWHECIEGVAEYHPIKGRIRFLVGGKPSKHASRNAYCIVIWRKK